MRRFTGGPGLHAAVAEQRVVEICEFVVRVVTHRYRVPSGCGGHPHTREQIGFELTVADRTFHERPSHHDTAASPRSRSPNVRSPGSQTSGSPSRSSRPTTGLFQSVRAAEN
jgi:hypothetical protein